MLAASADSAPPPVYFDNNATTRPLDAVVAGVAAALAEHWHNPSSTHRPGQTARGIVERARRSVADLIGATPAEITFTSGATEALDLAIRGILGASPPHRRTVLTTAIEHEAVRDCLAALAAAARIELVHLPLDADGVVVADEAGELLRAHRDDAALLTMQWANNETGVIQPVAAIGQACRLLEIPFLVDGTQWVGKMPTGVNPARSTPELGSVIDLLAFSAHKMHGPKGTGALYTRRGVRLTPTIRGVQERERRGGTENVPGIAGFGCAADAAQQWLTEQGKTQANLNTDETNPLQHAITRRNAFERELLEALRPLVPGMQVNAASANRLWNTTNLALPGLDAEALVLALSERGLAVSAGAACASGSLEPSAVLTAMGLPEPIVQGSIRLSAARHTTGAERRRAIEALTSAVRALIAPQRSAAESDID